MIDVVYLDMDGVIADFDSRYDALFERDGSRFLECFTMFVENREFEKLKPMPEYKRLIDYCDENFTHVYILTSVFSNTFAPDIIQQKLNWLKDNDIRLPMIPVANASLKATFANENSLLIDDSLNNCTDWFEEGGHAIRHLNTSLTIEQIKTL